MDCCLFHWLDTPGFCLIKLPYKVYHIPPCAMALYYGCILVPLIVELCINQEVLSPHIVKMGK